MRVFDFNGFGKGVIIVNVLDKAPKGAYKNDIIKLEAISETDNFSKLMTPYEAILFATGLLNAISSLESKKGYDKGVEK